MSSFGKILSKKNFLLVYLVIIFLFNILLINLPLTRVFGYEFSALNGILLSLLSGIYSIFYFRGKLKSHQSSFNNLIFSSLLFLIIPAVVSVTNSLLTINCSLLDGLWFYLVITMPSVFIGIALAVLSLAFFKRFTILSFVIIYIFILLIPLGEFYFNPQIYFFNPFFGYYPGTIYDEGISVNLKLISYRFFNLIFFSALFYAGYNILFKNNLISKKALFFFTVLAALLFYYLSPFLGYSTTFNRLDSELNNKIITEHFVIHLPS